MDPTPSARARGQYATTTGNLTARMALHRHGTYPRSWFSWVGERLPAGGDVLEVGAGTGGLLAAATNGRDHLAEVRDIGPAIGRPELIAGPAVGDFTAENGPALVERHFTGVTVERYPGAVAVALP